MSAEERRQAFRNAVSASNIKELVFMATTFRSGSTHLGRLLHERTGIAMHLEKFNQVSTWFKLSKPECARRLNAALGSCAGGLYGTKIMWPHRNALACFLGLDPRNTDLFQLFPEPKFILLTRSDKAAQAISFHVARSLDNWTERVVVSSNRSVDYNFRAIYQYYLTFISHDELWRSYLSRHGRQYVPITQEDLMADGEKCLREISNALDLQYNAEQGKSNSRGTDALHELKVAFRDRFLDDLHRYSPLELLPSRLIGPPEILG